jgi:hypothetical protein
MDREEIERRFAALDMTMAKLDEKLDLVRSLLMRNEQFRSDPFASVIAASMVQPSRA